MPPSGVCTFSKNAKRDGRLCPQEAFPTAVDRSFGDRVIRPFLLVAMNDMGQGRWRNAVRCASGGWKAAALPRMAALRIAVYEGWAKIEGKSQTSPKEQEV